MLNTHTLQITPEILNLISRIDEFKGAWRALGTLAPDSLSSLRRVATIESIGASTRDEQEVAGYAELNTRIGWSTRTFFIAFSSSPTELLCPWLLRDRSRCHRPPHRSSHRPWASRLAPG